MSSPLCLLTKDLEQDEKGMGGQEINNFKGCKAEAFVRKKMISNFLLRMNLKIYTILCIFSTLYWILYINTQQICNIIIWNINNTW